MVAQKGVGAIRRDNWRDIFKGWLDKLKHCRNAYILQMVAQKGIGAIAGAIRRDSRRDNWRGDFKGRRDNLECRRNECMIRMVAQKGLAR